MIDLSVQEIYKLVIRGEKYITICELYVDGKQAAFGTSKVDGKKNYRADLGKKLALAMAFRFFIKTKCKSSIIDNTNTPIFEDDNVFEGTVEYGEAN